MIVPALRRALAIGSTSRELVALQHDDTLEKPGERPGGRQTTHAGADHDGLLADHSLRHPVAERPRASDNALTRLRDRVYASPSSSGERDGRERNGLGGEINWFGEREQKPYWPGVQTADAAPPPPNRWFARLSAGAEWIRTFSPALDRQRFVGFVRVSADLPAHRTSEQLPASAYRSICRGGGPRPPLTARIRIFAMAAAGAVLLAVGEGLAQQ